MKKNSEIFFFFFQKKLSSCKYQSSRADSTESIDYVPVSRSFFFFLSFFLSFSPSLSPSLSLSLVHRSRQVF